MENKKNIVPVTLSGCTTQKIVTADLWQYDYGQKYQLCGNVPEQIRADIISGGRTYPAEVAEDNTISIPDEALQKAGLLVCYIAQYDSLQDPKHRRTIYEIQTQVRTRPAPEGNENV